MPQPNFVIIMTDTQGVNVLGCYGRPELKTPNIDRLAAESVKFNKAYTTSPVCTPARSALFTGIYACKSGGWSNSMALQANVKTMGQRFRDHGYQTAYTGKWHLDGHDYFGDGLCPDGWDESYWYDGKRYLDTIGEDGLALREAMNNSDDLGRFDIAEEYTWAHGVTERGIAFLQAQPANSTPFLLVVSYDEPHAPFFCPAKFIEPFNGYRYDIGQAAFDALASKPSHQLEWARSNINPLSIHHGKLDHQHYFACNHFVDAEVGRLLSAIDQYSPENTCIIFTSDHGDMLGAHQLTGKGPVAYDDICRIPFVIKPAEPTSGFENNTLVSHIDILPTMLELAGLPRPEALDGTSLVPQLKAQADAAKAVVISFDRFEISNDSLGGLFPIRAIVQGDYKLVINLMTSDELYDLNADPAELNNLISDQNFEHIRDSLHDALLSWMHTRRDPFRSPYWQRRPWRDSKTYGWWGHFRHPPADGYAPVVRHYRTGRIINDQKN